MESSSILKFNYETSINGKIPFLDVDIKIHNGQFVSDVFRKLLMAARFRALSNTELKLSTYCRYVDDIYVVV